MAALPGGGQWQTFLRSHGNRYGLACSIRKDFEHVNASKENDSDTLVFYGCGDMIRSGESDAPFGVEEIKESDGPRLGNDEEVHNRKDLWVWRGGAQTHEEFKGPCIGEGELATTHCIIHNGRYSREGPRTKWTITSTDTDQIVHVLLAMASGVIAPDGADKVDVTVRQRRSQGASDFLLVNRLYAAVHGNSEWAGNPDSEASSPDWLTKEAKVVVYVLVYLLSGCDFCRRCTICPSGRWFLSR